MIRQIEGSIRVTLEKKKEMNAQEEEDKKKIFELKINIQHEKEAIENELLRLHNYEKQYNEELNFEKGETRANDDLKRDASFHEKKPSSLRDTQKELSDTSGQAKQDTKTNPTLPRKPSVTKVASRTSLSPTKRSKASSTAATKRVAKPSSKQTNKPSTSNKGAGNK